MWEGMNVTAVVKRVTLPGSVNSRLELLLGTQLIMREMPTLRLRSRPAVGGESFEVWKRGKYEEAAKREAVAGAANR